MLVGLVNNNHVFIYGFDRLIGSMSLLEASKMVNCLNKHPWSVNFLRITGGKV